MNSKSVRHSQSSAPFLLLLAGVCVCAACSSPEEKGKKEISRPPQNCVVLEKLSDSSSLLWSGVRAGDAVVAWERISVADKSQPRTTGQVKSVLDWTELEINQAPAGPVRLHLWREGRELEVQVPVGLWDARVRPCLPDTLLSLYDQGRLLVEGGDVSAGLARWEQASHLADEETIGLVRLWLGLRSGETLLEADRPADSERYFKQALEEATARRDPVAQIAALNLLAKAAEAVQDEERTKSLFLEVKRLREEFDGRSLGLAKALHALGRQSLLRGHLDEAELYIHQNLAILRDLAPESLEMASGLSNLGYVADERGDLAEAERSYRLALAQVRLLAPGGELEVAIVNNLAVAATTRGRLDEAEEAFLRALEIARFLGPQSPRTATLLANLCAVASERGELDRAEEFCIQAHELRSQQASGWFEQSNSLFLMGNVAQKQRQYDKAESYYHQALMMREKENPRSLPTAFVLHSLGNLATERGLDHEAETFHRRALELRQDQAPGGLAVADSLLSLGRILRLRGEFGQALKLQRGALATYERLAPDSQYEAEAQHELGLNLWLLERKAEALQHLRAAVETIEAQAEQVGGGQSGELGFRQLSQSIYYRLAELLFSTGRYDEAFAIAERSRSRVFLSLLTQRDLVFQADISPELDQARRMLAARYERTQQRLAMLSVENAEAVELRTQLRLMQTERERLTSEIRERSPRLAALKYPQPLNFDEARAALEQGTAMLSWAVGTDKTLLFVVIPGQLLAVHEIPIGGEQLRSEVERFTSLLLDNDNRLGSRPRTGLRDAGRNLFRKLIGPAEVALSAQRRVLLLPDGALHLLPFSALIRDLPSQAEPDERTWQYFLEWKPIHVALSATVYAGLSSSRERLSSAGIPPLVAFGDPSTRSLPRLPGSADEVRRIGALYPQAEMHVAEEATEARVRKVRRDTPILHFACHGLLDETLPLNSALALTQSATSQGGEDNGLLQAWEILEQIRLNADLVVLSACETSRGQLVAGEGLIGLTRAFQHAGARSVVASLWRVSDRSTAELMFRFHRHLRQGMPKDEALQAAQIELLQSDAVEVAGDTSAPYHWAAFQLFGERR